MPSHTCQISLMMKLSISHKIMQKHNTCEYLPKYSHVDDDGINRKADVILTKESLKLFGLELTASHMIHKKGAVFCVDREYFSTARMATYYKWLKIYGTSEDKSQLSLYQFAILLLCIIHKPLKQNRYHKIWVCMPQPNETQYSIHICSIYSWYPLMLYHNAV